jgi:hypothetical protein
MVYDSDYHGEEDYSIGDDPAFEEAAREWADENAEELVAAYADTDLEYATHEAHKNTWPRVEASLVRAEEREKAGHHEEATFHYARALEGYIRAVLLHPVFEVMTSAFKGRLKLSELAARDIMPSQLRNAPRLIHFALIGITGDAKQAWALRQVVLRAVKSDGAWAARNSVSHSLEIPAPEEVQRISSVVRDALAKVSTPIATRISEIERNTALLRSGRTDIPF